jgi:hypothetical protein
MEAPPKTVERAKELRRKLTLPEVILWRELRGRKLDGARFRRQHPIGPFILDFYCDETSWRSRSMAVGTSIRIRRGTMRSARRGWRLGGSECCGCMRATFWRTSRA